MSYCRWSDDGFQSDVYAYESNGGGFSVHVASKRYDRAFPEFDFSSVEAMREAQRAREIAYREARLLPIGLPEDGKTFHCGSREALLARLLNLREIGYRVPQHAIDAVVEEMNEEDVP